jgi:hypothetical protein
VVGAPEDRDGGEDDERPEHSVRVGVRRQGKSEGSGEARTDAEDVVRTAAEGVVRIAGCWSGGRGWRLSGHSFYLAKEPGLARGRMAQRWVARRLASGVQVVPKLLAISGNRRRAADRKAGTGTGEMGFVAHEKIRPQTDEERHDRDEPGRIESLAERHTALSEEQATHEGRGSWKGDGKQRSDGGIWQAGR